MKNIKLTISYDGTHYLGWQETRHGQSIEASLKQALKQILQEKIKLQAASRTDRGVHAQGQVVNFFTSKKVLELSLLHKSLNTLLPPDIAILSVQEAPLSFHPTIDCVKKKYLYHVCTSPVQLPQNRFYSWHFPRPLDKKAMLKEIPDFLGVQDFSSFCNQKNNDPYSDTIREVMQITISSLPEKQLCFRIEGRHFLYKMVRNIVGYLLYVGCGKQKRGLVPSILHKKDRKLSAITAPAHGLSLFQVSYL